MEFPNAEVHNTDTCTKRCVHKSRRVNSILNVSYCLKKLKQLLTVKVEVNLYNQCCVCLMMGNDLTSTDLGR